MRWIEVTIATTKEASEAVSSIMMENGSSGVRLEDPELPSKMSANPHYDEVYDLASEGLTPRSGFFVIAYFPEDGQLEEKLDHIRNRVAGLSLFGLDAGLGTLTCQTVDEADWANAWKAFYHPIKIGEHFLVCPTWEHGEATTGDRIIRLDPGMAFGTGDHPTSALCLEVLESFIEPEMKVIDLGTGSGILAIGAALLGAEVNAIDIDPVAVNVASENVAVNGVSERVNVAQGTLDSFGGQVQLIVANIVADVITAIAKTVPDKLVDGGIFLASGIIDLQRAQVETSLQDAGLDVLEIREKEGWVCFVARKVNRKHRK